MNICTSFFLHCKQWPRCYLSAIIYALYTYHDSGYKWVHNTAGRPPRVSEGVQINKLNTHCIKDKGWTAALPSSLRTLWKLRENVCIASEESRTRLVRQETL